MAELTPEEQEDQEETNKAGKEGAVSGAPNDGPTMAPYAYQGKAQGGWSAFPDDESGTPYAVGGESIMAPRYPGEAGGRGYSITALKGRGGEQGYAAVNLLVDNQNKAPWYDRFGEVGGPTRKPTTQAIIDWATENSIEKVKDGGGGNKRPYKYTDFVFCKYWNKIPNNYLLTLRRYPYPAFDNLSFPGENGSDKHPDIVPQSYYAPITQAITYMGDSTGNGLDSLLKYSVKLPYGDQESKVHEVSQQSPGADGGPAPGFAKVLGILSGGADFKSISNGGKAPMDPYSNGPYMNKIYGPINVIKKVKQRKQGLEFTQSFSLVFHYRARPIGGVNTKAIMLDIMANMLVLTYAEGAFWGGAVRFTGGSPQYPFLGGKAGMNALYSGDIAGFTDALSSQLADAASTVSSLFNSFLSDPIGALKKAASGGLKLGLAKMLGNKKAQLKGMPALLTGNPVGEWHLTVGNPFNPMLEIGNLVCTGCDFEFGKELGPDDFPLDLKCTVKLEHGMPRDKAAIESMFNRGGGKIYHLPDTYQFGMASWSLNPNAGRTPIDGVSGGTGVKLPGEKNNKSESVHNKSILLGDPKDIDNIWSSAQKGGNKIFETARVGFGYQTPDKKPE